MWEKSWPSRRKTGGLNFLNTAVAVVCGLGESRLILGIYLEQFELGLLPFDGFKMR
jgi:hypothetical protein